MWWFRLNFEDWYSSLGPKSLCSKYDCMLWPKLLDSLTSHPFKLLRCGYLQCPLKWDVIIQQWETVLQSVILEFPVLLVYLLSHFATIFVTGSTLACPFVPATRTPWIMHLWSTHDFLSLLSFSISSEIVQNVSSTIMYWCKYINSLEMSLQRKGCNFVL